MMFDRIKYRRRLSKIGSCVESSFLLYVNEVEPMTFPDKESVVSYLTRFRDTTPVYNLKIYRVETYSI